MSQILLVKLQEGLRSYGEALVPSRHCRLDPASSQHAAVVDEQGVLHYFHIDLASKSTVELLSFQLQFRASSDASLEPISKPWMFEFVPGLPGEIMIVQPGSARILYASLPRRDDDASDVFLFGAHTEAVNCIKTNGNIALSGCEAGVLKLWRMIDGQLSDSAPLYDARPAAVTAVECLGPLLVAAGNSAGQVTLYDIASGRLLAVQRLQAGQGPVTCLASWLDTEMLSDVVLAAPGPRVPDGGGVLPGPNIGLPWRQQQGQQQEDAAGGISRAPAALLAVCSSAGWLRIYQASQPGPLSWQLLHSSHGAVASPISAIAFTPDGTSLAVAGPAAQILGTEAVAIAATGGQPGAVSLYRVSRDAGVQQNLQIWQQWCLRSLPVGLLVLPSSHVELMRGKQLGPLQVLQLLITPELGQSLVLTATETLDHSGKLQQPALPGRTISPELAQQQQADGERQPGSAGTFTQQQLASSREGPVGGTGDGFDRVDIAERDWSAVVDAIEGTRPLQEADVIAMLEDLLAETSDLLDTSAGDLDPSQQQQQQDREQQAGPGAHQHNAQQQQLLQPDSQPPGARKQLFAADSSSSSAAGRAAGQTDDPLRRVSLQASGIFDQGLTIVNEEVATLEQGPLPVLDLQDTFGFEQRPALQPQQQQQQQPGDVTPAAATGGREEAIELLAAAYQMHNGDARQATCIGFEQLLEQHQQRQDMDLPVAAAAVAGADDLEGADTTHTASSGLRDLLSAAAGDYAAAAAGLNAESGTAPSYQSFAAHLAEAASQAAAAEVRGLVLEPGAAAANAARAAAANQPQATGADSEVLFKRPSTLPTLRSWMDRAAALASGTAAEGPSAAISIGTIAAEMRQQQEAVLEQQQQQQQQEAMLRQQQVQQQQDQEAAAAAKSSPQQQQQLSEAEDELPGESTFQDLLLQKQQQQAAAVAAAAAVEDDYDPQLSEATWQNETASLSGPSPDVATEAAANRPAANSPAAIPAVVAAAQLRHSLSRGPSPAAAAAAAPAPADDDLSGPVPQPRALPAALQMQRRSLPRGLKPLGASQKQQHGSAAAAAAAGVRSQQWQQQEEEQYAGEAFVAERPKLQPLQRPAAASISAAVEATAARTTAEPVATPAISDSVKQQRLPEPGVQPQQQQQENERPKVPRNVRDRLALRQKQQPMMQQEATQSSAAVAAAGVVLPVNDHPLAAAVENSSRLLARKIQEAEEAPKVAIDGSDVVKLAVQLADLDVDFDRQQYQGLPDVKDIPTPTKAPKVLPKQLDPRWLASRNLKPQIDTLFKPSDWHLANIQPQVLVLPQWSTPQEVVQRLLWPGTC